jgi:FkbM family methyltransferase
MSRIIKLFLFLAAILGMVWLYAPARLAAIVLVGRSPVCPMANAVQAAAHNEALRVTKDRILAASKKIQEDPAGYELWQTPGATYWIPRGSQWALPFNLAEQDLNIYGIGSQAMRANDIVLDCGANVGVFTRKALAAGAKLVVAIEPAPENIEVLKRNFPQEIAAGRVIVYEKGVWDKDDVMTLQIDPHNSAADSFVIQREGGHEGAKVPLTTIDKLAAELKLERVDYIKMDIEGAEQRALMGARQTIAKYHPRLSLSAYHNPEDPEKIPQLVRQAWDGYQMECGPCAEIPSRLRIRPDVLYFR